MEVTLRLLLLLLRFRGLFSPLLRQGAHLCLKLVFRQLCRCFGGHRGGNKRLSLFHPLLLALQRQLKDVLGFGSMHLGLFRPLLLTLQN